MLKPIFLIEAGKKLACDCKKMMQEYAALAEKRSEEEKKEAEKQAMVAAKGRISELLNGWLNYLAREHGFVLFGGKKPNVREHDGVFYFFAVRVDTPEKGRRVESEYARFFREYWADFLRKAGQEVVFLKNQASDFEQAYREQCFRFNEMEYAFAKVRSDLTVELDRVKQMQLSREIRRLRDEMTALQKEGARILAERDKAAARSNWLEKLLTMQINPAEICYNGQTENRAFVFKLV